ncbi:MAG: DUF1015 domain-containing protein [Acidobacteria bacterium]|nr:DUF1015 domain-containing protein [Acidobacteriota bacterium]
MLILPFRALRFNPERVRLSDAVTQPYDKIDRAMQAAYYQKSPYNLVRVIKSREADVRGEEGYAAAGRLWGQWIRDGVLVQDSEPAYFIYRQNFAIGGKTYSRHALVGLLDLKQSDRVLAHERTLAGPRNDRLRLIRQTESNDGLIFLLYRDSSGVLSGLSQIAGSKTPLEWVVDEYATQHEIFSLGAASASFLEGAFDRGDLIIADGHHRFAVALQFREECEARGWKAAAPESFNKRMVAVVEMSDPGLVILPTHRVVFGVAPYYLASWEERMSSAFEKSETRGLEELLEKLSAAGAGSFGVFGFDRWVLWTLRRAPPPEELDVSILHREILGKTLGISEQQVAAESRVRYFREPFEAMQDVKLGNGQLAFFLNATRIEQVEACARLHQVMPQKSTDFFPKMLSGLLFMRMEIDKR